jgi:site-specific recombinase XerD
MPKIKDCSFFLKDPKATAPTLINFHMTLPDGKLKRSLTRFIHPGKWDFADQRPLPTKDKALKEIDTLIQSMIDVIPVVREACRRNNQVIARADINAALDVILQTRKPEKVQTAPNGDMFADFKTIIAGMKDGTIQTPGKNKKRYKPESVNNFEKAVAKIKEYYTERKTPSSYNSVTIDRYSDFLTWCHSKDLANNSIGFYVKCWKRLGKIALKQGKHSNAVFNDEEFAVLKEETEDIYLDETKINTMYKLKLVGGHEVARDWFVLDCYLGLRVSDLKAITMQDFADGYFQFVNQKTGAKVAIKINRVVIEIIKKWKGLPPPMNEDTINVYIKEVAKSAKLNKKFIHRITKGGILVTETLEEWQMISSHNARRSFITNLLKLGIPHAQVMRLAGIKRYDTLMRYFKQTAEEVARETGENEFFK